jgi:glycosyltransferase involved in cell wall biosynthesis
MQHANLYDSAMVFAMAKQLPLVTIVHDVSEGFEKVYQCAKGAQKKEDGKFYRFARHRLCVSPEMEEFCFRKYGVRGEVMYPNRDESLRPRPPEWNRKLRKPPQLTVGFVGNVNYGYGEALVELLPVFEKTRSRLRIWGPSPGQECRALAENANVSLEGFLPSPEVWEPVKRECDAVILPYSSSDRMKQLYSYHFPSKLPEYLALGMPVIITGPKYATGIRWALKNSRSCVFAVTDNKQKLHLILKQLKKSAQLRVELAHTALKTSKRAFDPRKTRIQFLQRLNLDDMRS